MQGIACLRALCAQFLAWDQEARNKVMGREKGQPQNAIIAHQFDHNVTNQVGSHGVRVAAQLPLVIC